MMEEIRNIIREEFEGVLGKTYSIEEVSDAISNKHFIHTKGGNVFSPVILKRDFVIGVDNDCQHVDIPLAEITLIQSAEERFRK
jgi:hypothetical protein